MVKNIFSFSGLIILLYLFAMPQIMLSQTVNFSVNTDFTTGTSPAAVTHADLNGDGKPDIIVTNYVSNTISVFLNTTLDGAATPTFSNKTDFITGNGPISVAIADLNGDGKMDIVVANSNDNTVSVYFNTTSNGASTPSLSVKTNFTTGTTPYYVAIADLNGDGKPDIITANPVSNNISVLLNTTSSGASTPSLSAKTDFVTGSSCRWVSIGDLNGDGKPDIVAANYGDNTISVLLNTTLNGTLTPSFSDNDIFTAGANPASVAIADLNRDGKPDIIIANYGSNTLSVLMNTIPDSALTPTFSSNTEFTTGTGPTEIAIADLDGDGKSDIVVANYNSNTFSVLLNTTSNGTSIPAFLERIDFITGSNPRGITISDVNGDSKSDIITANIGTNNMSVFLNSNSSSNTSIELISDMNFSNGIGLQGVSTSNPSVIDTLYPTGVGQSDFLWTLAQWGSRFNLNGVPPEYSGDSIIYADSGKSIKFIPVNGSTQVDMEVFGSAEYLSPRTVNEGWPCLYLAQTFKKQLGLSSIKNLIFKITSRLIFSINEMSSATYNPNLHSAQFQIYFIIQNLNTSSVDYGDYLWFGLPLYDYRYQVIPAYAAQDVGKDSTGKFIYNLSSSDLYTGNFSDGDWINISKDIYPSILQAFQVAQARGYLKSSSISDMCMSSMNLGWEIPGTFNSGIQYKDLGLTASTTNTTSVNTGKEKILVPTNFILSQNYPNPFNPTTDINYSLPKSGFVTLKVYNLLGQEVGTLVNQEQKPGNYSVNFNATKLASGVYLYRVQSGAFSLTKKMILLK